jgi:hypothetical protein
MPELGWNPVVELDWMLQNGEIEDDVLVEALVSEYFLFLRQISLFIVKDSSHVDLAVKNAIKQIVKRRHKINGAHRIRTLLFASVVEESKRITKSKPEGSKSSSPLSISTKRNTDQHLFFDTTSEKSDLNNKISSLEFLYLYLQFSHGYSWEDIAVIMGSNGQKTMQEMVKLRINLMEMDAGSKQSLNNSHPLIREKIVREKCGFLSEENQVHLDLHLSECKLCKDFSDRLQIFENYLLGEIVKLWPQKKLERKETNHWVERVYKGSQNSRKKSIFFNVKELILGSFGLVLIALMGWYGSSFYIMRSEHIKNEAAPVNVFIQKVTATPQQVIEKMETSVAIPINPKHQTTDQIITRQLDETNTNIKGLSIDNIPYSKAHPPHKVSGSSALAAVLYYWGWDGTVDFLIEFLQPDPYRSKLLPSEIVEFVRGIDGVKAIAREGGDFNIIQNGIDAGYPIIVYKDYGNFNRAGKADTYQVVYGYNLENEKVALLLDIGLEAVYPVSYDAFSQDWSKSEYKFIIVFPEIEEYRVRRVFNIPINIRFSHQQTMKPAGSALYHR